jgi:hypothetical protein
VGSTGTTLPRLVDQLPSHDCGVVAVHDAGKDVDALDDFPDVLLVHALALAVGKEVVLAPSRVARAARPQVENVDA